MSEDGYHVDYGPFFILLGLFFVVIISVCVITHNHNQNIRAAEQEKVAEETRIASVFKELDTYKNEHYGKEYEEILKDNNSYKELVRIKENYKKKCSLDENIFKYRKPKDLNYDLRDFIPSDKHFDYDSFEVENWADIDAAYSDSVNKLQQDIDNLPEIKALNDRIKEDEGYKAIVCKLDKGYVAKEKEAKKLQEEQAAKKKAINKKQNVKNSEHEKVVVGVLCIIFFIGISIVAGIYNFPKLLHKIEEKKRIKITEEEKKKEILEKFISSCEY